MGDNFELTGKIVVLSACGFEEEASRSAGLLMDRQLAACADMIQKTTKNHFPESRDVLRSENFYELPEMISLPVANELPEYLAWMGQ